MTLPCAAPIIKTHDLRVYYPITRGALRRVVGRIRAVDGVSLSIGAGETLGLVGESGCGKSTLGLALMRLAPATSGTAYYLGEDPPVDILRARGSDSRRLRLAIQMVFQNPASSLNPRATAGGSVAEPIRLNRLASPREVNGRVERLLTMVGLGAWHGRRYPSQLSGGQRQRVVIARALALESRVIIADEPVSALDVSVQAQILNLLNDLKAAMNLTYLFISHNLDVVRHMANRIAVMYLGRIVELGPADEVCTAPRHPYTETLLSAILVPDIDVQRARRRIVPRGDVPDAAAPHEGCPFHTRCLYAKPRCEVEVPLLDEVSPGCHVACHLAGELTLAGIDAQYASRGVKP
ncbi:MAG: ABC transporter ATP-binding protein [bacterium]